MTTEEFLEKLKATPRNWRIVGHSLRLGDDAECSPCPITSVHGKGWDATMWDDTADCLGLDPETARDLMFAADAWETDGDTFDPSLRARLLDACGLPEETA